MQFDKWELLIMGAMALGIFLIGLAILIAAVKS